MKYLVVSDIHGNTYYTGLLKEILIKEKCDEIILLGDLFNLKYSNLEELNNLSNIIHAIRGNCDYNEYISEISFP